MGIGKILGSISPLAGAVTGEGLFGGLRKVTPAMMLIDSMKDKKKQDATRSGSMVGRNENVKEYKKGGKAKKMAKGGSTASKRADGCATKGKTKGRFV
jgi:hypothetical protein